MAAMILLSTSATAVAAMMILNMRSAFFAFVFLYGVYPKFLSLGLGEQGFALSGPRVFISILFLGYLARMFLNSANVKRGLGRLRSERLLIVLLAFLVMSKLIGTAIAGDMSLASAAAFIDELLIFIFAFILAVTYLRTVRDVYILFGCIAASVVVNEIVVVVEWIRGGSVFHGLVELAYELASEKGSVEGRIREGSYRIMGLTVNPLNLASILCISLPGLLTLAFRQRDLLLKTFAIAALIGIGPALVGTSARGAIVLSVLVACSAVAYNVARRFNRPLYVTAVILGGLTLATMVALFGLELMWTIASIGGEQGMRSAESRVLQYSRILPVVLEHPLFGVGYARNYALLLDAGHMDGHYLRTVVQGGLVGLAAFVMALLRGIWLTRLPRQTAIGRDLPIAAIAVRASLLVVAVLMLVYSQHNTVSYLALLLGASVAIRVMDGSAQWKDEPALVPGHAAV